MSLAYPHDFATKVLLLGSELQQQFDAVGAVLDAGIVSANISPTAGILPTQLSVSYEHLLIPITIPALSLTAGWPAGGAAVWVGGAAFPGLYSGAGSESGWICTGVSWACTDIGAGTGTFHVAMVHYAGGAWVTDANLTNAATAFAMTTGNAVLNGGGTSYTLPTDASTPHAFFVRSVGGADATMLNAAPDFLTISVRLARVITAAVI